MSSLLFATALVLALALPAAQPPSRNIWESQYKTRAAADMARQFENDGRPVYRHRAEIIRLLELRPGMAVAEIGAGSGFLSLMAARAIGPAGRVTATELDPKMVAYMNDRAKAEGLSNFTATAARTDSTGLAAASADAVVIVNTYSFFDRPQEMLASVAQSMRRGALLVIVDFPPADGSGAAPDGVVATAKAAGLQVVDRHDVVPGHYLLRFRKP